MKILLVVHDVYQNDNEFPLGIGYLTSILRREGHEAVPYCQDVFHYSNEELAKQIQRWKPDIIGVPFMAARFRETIKPLCKTINKVKGKGKLILGGHGPSPIPQYMLDTVKCDSVVCGEAENSILQVVNDYPDLKPIYHSKPVRHIDSIPFPHWDLFPMSKYTDCIKVTGMKDTDKFINIVSSRGCTNACTFCYRMENGLRLRSIENLIDEMKLLHDMYGVTWFEFADECFILNKKRLEKFYCALQDNNLNIKYICAVRAEFADEDSIKLMKESGCEFINYGFESMDETVLREMKKNTTPEQNEYAAKITREIGVPYGLNFIWGYANDNRETIMKSVDFIKKYNMHWELRTIRPVTPYPGSELYYQGIERGIIQGPGEFFEKFNNSDLMTYNFTSLNMDNIYKTLYEANTELIRDHHAYGAITNEEAESMREKFRRLYFEGDVKFRGARHYEKDNTDR